MTDGAKEKKPRTRRDCCGAVNRRKGGCQPGAPCLQPAIVQDDLGNWWCYYHDPRDPKKFGEGQTRD
jgi:hypothetical protein